MSDWWSDDDEEELEKLAEELDGKSSGMNDDANLGRVVVLRDSVEEENIIGAVNSLKAPDNFPFPFEPYDIQRQLMRQVYHAIEHRSIGIFESPTGTGKSLSLICAAATWLKDNEKRRQKEVEDLLLKSEVKPKAFCTSIKDTDPPWLTAVAAKRTAAQESAEELKKKKLLLEMEERLMKLRENLPDSPDHVHGRVIKRKRSENESVLVEEQERTTPQDTFDSDSDGGDGELLDSLRDEVHVVKIFYCSRTHSQLAQFVQEIKSSPYGSNLRVTSLGSRQNMCVNGNVLRLKSLNAINDRCVEMQKNTTKKDNEVKRTKRDSCPFYNLSSVSKLSLLLLDRVKDIEELVSSGRKLKACPYYASRHSIAAAELVALPYNTLLHASTRQASGIKLEENIVIIDEAHNLLDTISQIHSVQVTHSQLAQSYNQLVQYRDRYKAKLTAHNMLHVNQLLHVITQIKPQLDQGSQQLFTVNEFLEKAGLDNLNFFTLLRYCADSHISRKLRGFTTCQPEIKLHVNVEQTTLPIHSLLSRMQDPENKLMGDAALDTPLTASRDDEQRTSQDSASSSAMYGIESLLQAMTNSYSDGRIIITKDVDESKSSIRYLLLNPALYFTDIVKQCRSVIIVGGTMQPVEDFKQQLFLTGEVKDSRIVEFSCGHVIPANQILPIALSTGPNNTPLNFTYTSRTQTQTLDSLGGVIASTCKIVPGGVVCFLPSYSYEAVVLSHLQKNGMLGKISRFKQVFREPKKANMVDQILTAYSKCIAQNKHGRTELSGAILFSVVGGKMSEGINFSDDLGRCVIMVGLPYPNLASPELKEKLAYLDKNMITGADGVKPGQAHYENLCMKAVNQSIGRAIRHRNDYASILLLDERYHRDSIINKLPGWLNPHVQRCSSEADAMISVQQFFKKRAPQV